MGVSVACTVPSLRATVSRRLYKLIRVCIRLLFGVRIRYCIPVFLSLCGKLIVTVPYCMTMLHDRKGLSDWQSFRYLVWQVVVFSVGKQLSLLEVLIIAELHEKFPSVYIIRRLISCSQESGTGRTRVPHEPASRLHAVFRTWNKLYWCLLLSYLQELSSLCRYSK